MSTEGVRQLRVLVVDDYGPALVSLFHLLPLLNCEVDLCDDPLQATEAALNFRPDVMFLDLAMPKKDGFTVARELRSAGLTDLRLVALTSFGNQETRNRCRKAGFDQFLQKPASADDLRSALAAAQATMGPV